MTELKTQVVVVGAGAAGLAAARRLRERDVDLLLLEARERIGGRAYTRASYDGSYPVELGAEFVHGLPASTLDLLRESGISTVGDEADAFELRGGRLSHAPDRFETIERVLARIDLAGPDCSIDAFIDSVPQSELSAEDRDAFHALIEGFDAALGADASAVAIAREWRSGVNDVSSRPVAGYAPLMQHLARFSSDRTLLQTQVERIDWSQGNVRVHASRHGSPLTVHARTAIVTVPVGVLQAQTDLFDPPLPERTRRAIGAIAMGPVHKVVLDFRRAFWESVDDGRYRDAGFFTAPGQAMRTVWTRLPQRTPLLVGWAGGGAAQRLIERGFDPVEAALECAAALFPSIDVRAELRCAYHHDWQADPFARGAYSYLRVGAADARDALAEPVEQTLFFAGEATSSDDAGTVAGALDSGYRSARSIAR